MAEPVDIRKLALRLMQDEQLMSQPSVTLAGLWLERKDSEAWAFVKHLLEPRGIRRSATN